MKKIRFFTFLLVIMLVFGFAGCQKGTASRPVTITLLLLGNKPTNGRADAAIAEINKITAERIGAVLKTRYIEWADWQNQYQLAMASGDKNIDLVITATDWLFGWEIARKGGFFPLTPELLQANAPKTWAAIPPEHWDICSEDGKIWFIPEDQYSQFTNHGMYWRKDWAARGGLENIEVFEDLEKYWDIVKQYYPQAVPWDAIGAEASGLPLIVGYIHGKNNVQPIGVMTGNFSIFQFNENDPYTVISYLMDGNELIEAAVLFDRWAKKGFWREDVLNFRGETRNLFLAGLSGSDQHHTNTFLQLREQMDIDQPGSEIQMFHFGQENRNIYRDIITHGSMAVNRSSRNVEKALQMYDLLRNDRQIYLLYNYGIEGVDYFINPDGKFRYPEGYNLITDGLGTNFWGGRMDEFEPVWSTWWDGRPDMLNYLNSFAKDPPLQKFSFNNSKVTAELAALGNVCATHLPAIHFGKTSNPVKAVEDFRAALRQAGYEKVKVEIQAQLNALKEKI